MGLNKRIEIKNEKSIKALIVASCLYYCGCYLYDITEKIPSLWYTRLVTACIKISLVSMMFLFWKKWGVNKEKIDWKDKKQYVVGLLVIVILCTYRYIYARATGEVKYPLHIPTGWNLPWSLFDYLFLAGFCEEYVCRKYIQGEVTKFFNDKVRFIAPIVAALVFGAFHYPQMGKRVMMMNIPIGLILGFSKQYIPRCTVVSVAMAHGVMDILLLTGVI